MRIHCTLAFVTLLSASLSAQVPNYVPSNGLVGWWPFNGNANDESGNGNNGTVNGATLTEDRFGNFGSAFAFNGISDNVTVPHNQQFDNQLYSISVWVSFATESTPSSGGFNVNPAILSRLGSSNSVTYDNLVLYEADGIAGFSYGNPVVYGGGMLDQFNDSNWHHLVMTIASDSVRFYFNGQLTSTFERGPNLIFNDEPLRMGRSQAAYWKAFEGLIDDVGLWNRPLGECEVQALYNAGSQGVSPTPVSFSGLNSSYTVADAPSTLVGSPTGGVFIGPGVTGNTFDPAAAGVGSHSVTYAYVDACGSVNVQSFCTEVLLNVGVGGSQLSTSSVHVYPNPNRGQFTVELELAGLVGLQVYDARGALVHNEVFTASGSRTQRNLDLSGLAKGTYTLQFQNNGGTITQTVVVE